MKADRLARLLTDGVSVDYETHKIQPGLLAPPPVVGSAAQWADARAAGALISREGMREMLLALLRDERYTLIGANIAFDLLVFAVDCARVGIDAMLLIFAAYEAGRIYDVALAQQLDAVAKGTLNIDPRTGKQPRDPETGKPGRYSLSICYYLVFGRHDAKVHDRFRQSYALLESIPIAEWPEEARIYPVNDATNTLEIALAQAGLIPRPVEHVWQGERCARCGAQVGFGAIPACPWRLEPAENLHDLATQAYTAWSLHLAAAWGLVTDPEAVEQLAAAAQVGADAGRPTFEALGYLRADGSEDQAVLKRAVAKAYGCTGTCTACGGSGKIHKQFSKRDPMKPVGKPVNCTACSATGLDLTTAAVPMTDPSDKFPTGQVQTGRDQLVNSGDEHLMAYGEYGEDAKILETYVPWLRSGASAPITLRPNIILETGRTSYDGPVQLLPRRVSARLRGVLAARGARVRGVRECIVPRPGWVYYSVDYTGGELVTHAESCFKLVDYSRMGEALNARLDVHSALGATMMGVSYEQFLEFLDGKHGPQMKAKAKSFRQGAKPGNFGFPGRMGVARLVLQAREQGEDTPWPGGPSLVFDGNDFVPGYKGTRFCLLIGGAAQCGVEKVVEWKGYPTPPVCLACLLAGEGIKESWFTRWPENKPYLKQIVPAAEEAGYVIQHYSNRKRGGCDGGSIANGWFQGFLADITKRAQCRVSLEQYTRVRVRAVDEFGTQFEGLESPLYGTRSIVFAHDELIGETPESIGAEVAERVTEIMVEEFRRGCPNHKRACRAEPTLMPRWYKEAACVRDANGRLQVWRPKE